jgi:polyene macrolide polyketide synthase
LVASGEDAASLVIADGTGRLVASVDALRARPLTAEQLAGATVGRGDSLFRLTWRPVGAPRATGCTAVLVGADSVGLGPELEAAGVVAPAYAGLANLPPDDGPAPDVVLLPVAVDHGTDPATAARDLTAYVLDVMQRWLAGDRWARSRLVVVTRGVVDAQASDVPVPAAAAVWGLVRSGQTEHPGRFGLLDLDPASADGAVLTAAIASDEPQLAVRGAELLAARLSRHDHDGDAGHVWDANGTVLVTGGTGGLGTVIARHLVIERGVRHVLLLSRRGQAAPGAVDLLAELRHHGADATAVACDVGDRDALAKVLDAVPAEHPLRAVVHTAGVVDDGVLASLTPSRMAAVSAPKADAAWHLHELTRGSDLDAFVLFSSAAGIFGAPGQGNYAAANAFVDALAGLRRAEGLPGISLAWGPWDLTGGMAGGLSAADRNRMRRSGIWPLPGGEGTALFDAAVGASAAAVLPVRLDLAALRVAGAVPPLLRGLARVPGQRLRADGLAEAEALVHRLAGLPAEARQEALMDVLRREAASVLGYADPGSVAPDRPFRDLGFDSLMAVELRNRLAVATGCALPVAVLFDHPTAADLVRHLLTLLAPDSSPGPRALLDELDRIEVLLESTTVDERVRDQVTGRLETLRSKWTSSGQDAATGGFDFESASDDEVFDRLDNQLGLS